MEHGIRQAGGRSGDREITVRFELEAAEALAGLAHSAMLQEENDHDDDDEEEEKTQPCNAFDLPPQDDDVAIVMIQQEKQTEKKTISVPVKFDDDEQDRHPYPHHHHQRLCCTASCNKSMSVGGGKSRQPLTETEKEARRMRRVLANRESARQTIRRRQAMFEELTRKAFDLVLENENLKWQKELAAKEYDSLKNTNDCLREQMAQMMATGAGEIENEANPIGTECPASASTSTAPFFFPSDQPLSLVPFPWYSTTRPSEAIILPCLSQNDNANSSVFPVTETWRSNLSTDQRNSNTIPNSGALLYVQPLPCFFPLHSPPNAAPPHSSNSIDRQNDTHLSNQYDHHHAGLGIPPEKRHKSETVLRPTPRNCVRRSSSILSGRLNVTLQHEDSSEEAVFPVTQHTANSVSEEKREPAPHSSIRPVNAAAAAEARRRRRELMKVKGNQAGQFPTN